MGWRLRRLLLSSNHSEHGQGMYRAEPLRSRREGEDGSFSCANSRLSARIFGRARCLAVGEEGGLSAEDAEHEQGIYRAEPLRSRRADEGGSFCPGFATA